MADVVHVRSAVAMRIVRLDRQKFNEAVSAGHYSCAPSTAMRSVRLFTQEDLIPLYVFARLLELNVLPRRAGQLACELASAVKAPGNENSPRVVYVRGENNDFFMGSERWDEERDHDKEGKHFPVLGPVILSVDFHVDTIRRVIAERIDFERGIIGVEGLED